VPWLVRWVQDLIVVVFFASAAYLLLPENELRPYARLVMGLVVIAALLAPAVELLQWEPTLWAPRLAPAGEKQRRSSLTGDAWRLRRSGGCWTKDGPVRKPTWPGWPSWR
jgi:Stage III sporulation protein AF (Spore_III_AF).